MMNRGLHAIRKHTEQHGNIKAICQFTVKDFKDETLGKDGSWLEKLYLELKELEIQRREEYYKIEENGPPVNAWQYH